MALKDLLFKKTKTEAPQGEPGVVYTPIKGKVISLKEIADGVFSEGILGDGCGIEPSEEVVCAPFAGKIVQVADTGHAIGIMSNDGMELLIHVGMDTVDMNGKGFRIYVKQDDVVRQGQKLMQFSLAEIKKAGHPATTAVILCGSEEGAIQEVQIGEHKIGEVLFQLTEK